MNRLTYLQDGRKESPSSGRASLHRFSNSNFISGTPIKPRSKQGKMERAGRERLGINSKHTLGALPANKQARFPSKLTTRTSNGSPTLTRNPFFNASASLSRPAIRSPAFFGKRAPDDQGDDDHDFNFGDETKLDDAESEGDLEEWVDGKTLFDSTAVFDEPACTEDRIETTLSLVNQLSAPFTKQSTKMRKDMVETLEPALKHAHLVLSHIASEIEHEKYIKDGIIAFDDTSDEFALAVQEEANEFSEAVSESQTKIKLIFEALREQEERRNQWWDQCYALFDHAAMAGEMVASEMNESTAKAISMGERKLKAYSSSDRGVGKGNKGKTDLDKLKNMMGL